MRAQVMSAWVLIAACQPVSDLTPPPSVAEARSTAMVVSRGDSVIRVHAREGAGYAQFAARKGDTLTALQFGCSLDDLGLLEGTNPTADIAQPWPQPFAGFQSPVTGGDLSWMSITGVPRALLEQAQTIQRGPTCESLGGAFDKRLTQERFSTNFGFVTKLVDGNVLVGTQDRKVRLFEANGDIRAVEIETTSVATSVYDNGRELIVVDQEARIYRGTLEGGFALDSQVDLSEPVDRVLVVGDPTRQTNQLCLESSKDLAWFDGQMWHQEVFENSTGGFRFETVIFVPGLGCVALVHRRFREVMFLGPDGGWTEEVTEEAALWRLFYIEGAGLLASDRNGVIHRRRSRDNWEPFLEIPETIITNLLPHGDGFLAGGTESLSLLNYDLFLIHPGNIVCPLAGPTNLLIGALVPFGERSFFSVELTGLGYESPIQASVVELPEPTYCSRPNP